MGYRRGNPGQLCTWQRTTCRLEHPILGTTLGCDHQAPPPLPNLKEYATVRLTDCFLLMLSMCWNSCFSSSNGLEHSICSHRSVLLAWKLEGGQGEFWSKINTAASHLLRTFRKSILSGTRFPLQPAQRLACGQRFLTASPTGPSRSGSYRISGKLENDQASVQFLLWRPCSLLVLPNQFLSYSLFSSFLWIVVGKIKYLENSF